MIAFVTGRLQLLSQIALGFDIAMANDFADDVVSFLPISHA